MLQRVKQHKSHVACAVGHADSLVLNADLFASYWQQGIKKAASTVSQVFGVIRRGSFNGVSLNSCANKLVHLKN